MNPPPSATGAPILHHPTSEPSAFTPESLINDVRRLRRLPAAPVPPLCFLEFDGDLTDWLVQRSLARPFPSWACFHTTMFALDLDGVPCGIIPRTIGGPYAVLIAEQLHASGARLIAGLTSAGRLAPSLPLPSLVVASSAIRDEGASYHYLPPSPEVACPSPLAPSIADELARSGFCARLGSVWTTDAPYRETPSQIDHWARRGVLAVEMQAASLFAFGQASHAQVALIARLSNATDHDGSQFDTGTHEQGLEILSATARAARPALV